MKRRSAKTFIMGILFAGIIMTVISCTKKPAITGTWKVISYAYHGTEEGTVQNVLDTQSYYSSSCGELFDYQYQMRGDTGIMKFEENGDWSWNILSRVTTIDTDAVNRNCSLQYIDTINNVTYLGTWKFSHDLQNVGISYDDHTGTGWSINGATPLQIEGYAITELQNNELKFTTDSTAVLSEFTLIR